MDENTMTGPVESLQAPGGSDSGPSPASRELQEGNRCEEAEGDDAPNREEEARDRVGGTGPSRSRAQRHGRVSFIRGALRRRQSAAREVPADGPRRLEGSQGPAGRGRVGPLGGEGTRTGLAAPAPRAHGQVCVHLLPGRRPDDGNGSGGHAVHRDPGPVLRGRAPVQFRRVCHAGAQSHLLHQRPRRDAAGAVGVGRQAPGRELRRGVPGQWPERGRGQGRGDDRRPQRTASRWPSSAS